jgi:hypothetical protein
LIDEFVMFGAMASGSSQRGLAYMSAQALRMVSAIGCLLLVACSTTVERVSDPGQLKSLGFLQTSPVARQEVEGRLGSPFAVYEDGRIVTYALRKDRDRFEAVPESDPGRWGASYWLVLVYRSDDTVERWSLVDRGHSR